MKFRQIIVSSIIWRGVYFFTVLILNIILARLFEASLSGLVYYFSNYFSFLLLIGSFCLESGMTFYASQKKIDGQQLAWLSVFWSCIVTVILLLSYPFWLRGYGDTFSTSEMIFFAVNYILGILLTTYFAALFYAEKNFSTPNIILAFTNLLVIVFGLILAVFKLTATWQQIFLKIYFLIYSVQGILLAFTYLILKEGFKKISLPNRVNIKTLLNYSFVVLMGNIVFFLLYRIDYWFVKNKCIACDAADLGNYIQVSKLGQLFLVFPTIIAAALFPLTASGNQAQARSNMLALSRALFVFNFIALATLAICGKWLFPFVFGESFHKMYLPFLLLIPGIFALCTISLIAAYNSGTHKMKQTLIAAIAGLLVIITGDILVIPKYGITGAALVSSIGYTIYFCVLAFFLFKSANIKPYQFFIPQKSDFLVLRTMLSKKTSS